METVVTVVDLLNDLIRINNDRIVCYEKTAQLSRAFAPELKNHFHQLAMQGKSFIDSLSHEVVNLGAKPSKRTTVSGRVYGIWTDLKTAVTGHDAHSLLSCCQHSEAAALRRYEESLRAFLLLDNPLRALIESQYQSLQNVHNNTVVLKQQTVK